MAISDKLLLLNNTKQQIRQAIESLGYSVGDIPFSQYPDVIDSMVVTEGGDLFQHGQALNYNFTSQRYGTRLPDGTINYTTDVNDLGILTRASTATYWGPEGSLLEAAVDEARIQHDPVTGEALGLLVESEATNINPYSDYSDTLAWAGSEGVVEADVILGAQATKYSGENIRRRAFVGRASDAGFRSTISFMVRSVSHNRTLLVYLAASSGSNAGADVLRIDFDTKNVLHTPRDPGSDFAIVGLSQTWLTNDTVKIEATVENGSNRTFGALWVGSSDFSGDFSLGAVDHKAGETASSFIPTTGSPVTRAADNAVIDLSDVLNPDEGTLRITAQVPEGEVVASLGDIQVVSDSVEEKTYRITYSGYTGVPSVTLGNGIHSRFEYLPEAQS